MHYLITVIKEKKVLLRHVWASLITLKKGTALNL